MKLFKITCVLFVSIIFLTLSSKTWAEETQPEATPSTPLQNTTNNQNNYSRTEWYVSSISGNLLPQNVVPQKQPEGFLGLIQSFFSGLGILNPLQFFNQSETLSHAYLPQTEQQAPQQNSTVQGVTTKDVGQQVNGFLGGFFGADLPPSLPTKDLQQTQKSFEQSTFPPGVNPLTGN